MAASPGDGDSADRTLNDTRVLVLTHVRALAYQAGLVSH